MAHLWEGWDNQNKLYRLCYKGNKTYTFVACQHLTNHRSYLLPHILQSNRDLRDNVHGGRGHKAINHIGGWLNAM